MAFVTAAVLMIFAFSYYSLTSAASTDTDDISYKYFTNIQIDAGDTLWSIADEYADGEHLYSKMVCTASKGAKYTPCVNVPDLFPNGMERCQLPDPSMTASSLRR